MAFVPPAVSRRLASLLFLLVGLIALPRGLTAQTCTTIDPPCPSNEKPRVVISPRTNAYNESVVWVTVNISDDRAMTGSPSTSPSLTLSGTWTGGNT